MVKREYWVNRIKEAWKIQPIVWLSGVRRIGKTTISKMFTDAIYLNCDLPSIIEKVSDIEFFYEQYSKNTIFVFDEIHRLENPSQVLKIAADEYPDFRILATGSSTLAALSKFSDTLTGRKKEIHLPPILWDECVKDFGMKNLDDRLLFGGLPDKVLNMDRTPESYSEWIDSFYARDINELFSIRQRTGFLKMLNLLFLQSGGQLNVVNFSKLSGISRPTVNSYLEALQIANAIHLLPPFFGGGKREIVKQPKCFAFDTGFVSFVNGWDSLRNIDKGLLWEHLVLEKLRTKFLDRNLYYWRDKSGREVDFVIKQKSPLIDTIECKISPNSFEPENLKIFRKTYVDGKNYLVCPFVKSPYKMKFNNLVVTITSLLDLFDVLSNN